MKARGDGLGFDLGRVQFQLSAPLPSGTQSATAKVDGNLLLRCPAWLVMFSSKSVMIILLSLQVCIMLTCVFKLSLLCF